MASINVKRVAQYMYNPCDDDDDEPIDFKLIKFDGTTLSYKNKSIEFMKLIEEREKYIYLYENNIDNILTEFAQREIKLDCEIEVNGTELYDEYEGPMIHIINGEFNIFRKYYNTILCLDEDHNIKKVIIRRDWFESRFLSLVILNFIRNGVLEIFEDQLKRFSLDYFGFYPEMFSKEELSDMCRFENYSLPRIGSRSKSARKF